MKLISQKSTRSQQTVISLICQNDKLPKLNEQLSRKKLMTSLRKALSNVVLNLLLSIVHVASNFVTASNCFSPPSKQKLISSFITFFSLLSGIFVYRVRKL